MASNTHSIDFELSTPQYGHKSDTAALSITGDFTIEGWFKLEQLPGTAGSVFTPLAKWDSGASKRCYRLIFSSDNNIYVQYSDDGTAGANISTIRSDTGVVGGDVGVWRHIVAAVDVSAQTADFYKDTVSLGGTPTETGAAAVFDSDIDFTIAGELNSGAPASNYDGKMNNMRLYNDIRTAQEVADNWKTVLTNTGVDNLVDSWYYNETHNSASGNANLTPVGAPSFGVDIPFIFPVPSVGGGNPLFMGGLAVG